jgi:hypothetical protein
MPPPRKAKRSAAKDAGSESSTKAKRAPTVSVAGLASLLEPLITEEVFFENHWEKGHVHSRWPARADAFRRLFTLDALLEHSEAKAQPQLRYARVCRGDHEAERRENK